MNVKKMKKILVFISMCICSVYTVNADYDEEYMVDLWGLGNLVNDSPLNFYDFTVTQDNSTVEISYVGEDCEVAGDFFVYIDGFGNNIECSGGGNNKPVTETAEFTMNQGTYELYFDYNFQDTFRISDVFIKIKYPEDNQGGGSMEQGIVVDNSFFGDINDYMDDVEFYHYMIIEIGFYLFILVSMTFYKALDIIRRRIESRDNLYTFKR